MIEDRLLTRDSIHQINLETAKRMDKLARREGKFTPEEMGDISWGGEYAKLKAQRDLTVKEKDAECQVEVELLIKWGGEHCATHHTRMNNILHRNCNECWQALKEVEL